MGARVIGRHHPGGPRVSLTDAAPVIDASTFVDALVREDELGALARSEVPAVPRVPEVFAAEVVSAVRGMLHRRRLSTERAEGAIERLRATVIERYPFMPFIDRVWSLRDRVTIYDAWYVALAESLETDLVTTDRRLIRVRGLHCKVRLPAQLR